jgi:hypothetical protein
MVPDAPSPMIMIPSRTLRRDLNCALDSASVFADACLVRFNWTRFHSSS